MPIGTQHFAIIRERGMLYVDKTALIYKLTHTSEVYFLSRPRRFGKSLLLDTLQCYFEGKDELFKGLAIYGMQKEWKKHAVLHIDFSARKYLSMDILREFIDTQLSEWERKYGIATPEGNVAQRFANVINTAAEKSNERVVLLIDEYDSPLLDTTADDQLRNALRNEMRLFFSPIKTMGSKLRFVFFTGISKFSQLSIFSELNNLKNISMANEYAALCGITESELRGEQFRSLVEEMAEANEQTVEECYASLRKHYDGYRFSQKGEHVYNPFSLLSALDDKMYDNYWFATGTPTFLIDVLRRTGLDISACDGYEAFREDFDAPTDTIPSPIPVLYQSGYLTIKGYDRATSTYTLSFPNEEVRFGLLRALMPSLTGIADPRAGYNALSIVRDLQRHDIDGCMERLRAFFAAIPYDLDNKTERHYQTIFYVLFAIMGQFVEAEVKSAIGRADAVLRLPDATYVFEFKLDATADEALAQIDSRHYAIPYAADSRPIYKIGIAFDSKQRTVAEWKWREG